MGFLNNHFDISGSEETSSLEVAEEVVSQENNEPAFTIVGGTIVGSSKVRGGKINMNKYKGYVEEKEPTVPVRRYVHKERRLDSPSVSFSHSLSNRQWKRQYNSIVRQTDTLHNEIVAMQPAVRIYRNKTEHINHESMSALNSLLDLTNRVYGSTFSFNAEGGLEEYATTLNTILSNTADNVDNLKSEIATMINSFISEINGLKVDKYKEIVLKVKNDIDNKSNKLVLAADRLIDVVSRTESITLESIKEILKSQEYIIGTLGADDTTVQKAIGLDDGLSSDQITRLAETLSSYIGIARLNPIIIDVLTSSRENNQVDHKLEMVGGMLKGFMVDLLPHLNITYKSILELLTKTYPTIDTLEVDQLQSALKTEVDKAIVGFIKHVGGFNIPEGTRSNLYHQNGYYILKPDGAMYKHNYEQNGDIPNMNIEKLGYIAGLMETISIPSSVLTQFPRILIALLNSEAMIVNNTTRLFNINLTLATILGLIGMYRDELIYGIYGVYKSISELTDAYYNVIKAVESVSRK